MNLFKAEVDRDYVVKENKVADFRLRFRLIDMGLIANAKVRILSKRRNKNNVLIAFNGVKYMLQTSILKDIEVDNA